MATAVSLGAISDTPLGLPSTPIGSAMRILLAENVGLKVKY